jgi:hypothetical protein
MSRSTCIALLLSVRRSGTAPHNSIWFPLLGETQDVGAMVAAALEGLRFQITAGGEEFSGTLGEKPVIYRSSIQVPGRRRPARHVVLLSAELMATTLGADSDARRTVLFHDEPDFILHRLSVRFGIPVLPGWADWFHQELRRRKMLKPGPRLELLAGAREGHQTPAASAIEPRPQARGNSSS